MIQIPEKKTNPRIIIIQLASFPQAGLRSTQIFEVSIPFLGVVAQENWFTLRYFLLKMGIFHCYVCLPEGNGR